MCCFSICWPVAGNREDSSGAEHMHADRVLEGHPAGHAVTTCVWDAGKDTHSHTPRKQERLRGVS